MTLTAIAIILTVVVSFIMGALSLYGYMVKRVWDNDDAADDSNIGNPARALNHFVLHGRDFQHAYYLSPQDVTRIEQELDIPLGGRRPFWYHDKDEYSEVVKTRPPFGY